MNKINGGDVIEYGWPMTQIDLVSFAAIVDGVSQFVLVSSPSSKGSLLRTRECGSGAFTVFWSQEDILKLMGRWKGSRVLKGDYMFVDMRIPHDCLHLQLDAIFSRQTKDAVNAAKEAV